MAQGTFRDNYCMRHYYVLNQDPRLEEVFEFIEHHKLACEVHLNRTRFWVPDGSILTEFVLRYGDTCQIVEEEL